LIFLGNNSDLAGRFVFDVMLSGEVLGVRPGTRRQEVEERLGADYLDDVESEFVRRDYGLLEVTFVPRNGWECAFLTVEMHRTASIDEGLFPAPILQKYGAFDGRVQIAGVVEALQLLGVEVEKIADENSEDFSRYLVASSGCLAHVQNNDDGLLRAGDIWSLTITRPDEVWRRPM
jgi:hypothetical protein